MKRFLPLLLVAPFLLTGCIKYNSGQTVGYVYAVDGGIVWDKVWIKTDLKSGESDCYLISDRQLEQKLKDASGKSQVRLSYDRHLFTLSIADCTNDEITSVDLVQP